MEEILSELFDYQRFENDPELKEVIDSIETESLHLHP